MYRFIKSSNDIRIVSNDWDEVVRELKDLWGFEVSSYDAEEPDQWIQAFKNGYEYEIEVNIYKDSPRYEIFRNNCNEVTKYFEGKTQKYWRGDSE